MFVISLIMLFAFCVIITQLFADAVFGATSMDKVACRTFGSILTVLILLEFNHSIFRYSNPADGDDPGSYRRAHRHPGRRSQNDASGFWFRYRPNLARAGWALAVPRKVVLAASRRRSSPARNPDKTSAVGWRSLGARVAAAAFPPKLPFRKLWAG